MSFHVGQKVECIDKGHSKHPGLVVGGIYTVAGVLLKPSWKSQGLLFVEIAPSYSFSCFESLLFRPLVEDRKSVSFTIGADPDSDRWDNRKKRKEKV